MKVCAICGKGSIVRAVRSQKQRGHYNPAGSKRKYPNLQKTRLADGSRVWACAKCIKRISRTK